MCAVFFIPCVSCALRFRRAGLLGLVYTLTLRFVLPIDQITVLCASSEGREWGGPECVGMGRELRNLLLSVVCLYVCVFVLGG